MSLRKENEVNMDVGYLAAHFVAGNGDEEQLGSIGIMSQEATLSNILKEIAFAGVFSGQFSWGLIKCIGITIWVYIDLEICHHFQVIQVEDAGRVENIRA